MKTKIFIVVLILSIVVNVNAQEKKDYYNEPREEFENRMQWFTDAKYGMFIHFGLYSQPGGVWKGDTIKQYAEWIQAHADIPPEEYNKLTDTFNPVDFDAEFIASLAEKAGMKYVVITAKHHEGFCLWDSKFTDYDIASTPFKRDILKELSEACRRHDIRFGTYYSIIDWHHPSQERNPDGNDGWSRWGEIGMKPGMKAVYVEYMKNQIRELIENYDTDILWFDGDWAKWWDIESGIDLYNYVRGLKPGIIINNRVAKRKELKKDFGTPEQVHLNDSVDYKWEACYTMNKTWGFKYGDDNWKQPQVIFDKLKEINSRGGNLLLNIGPNGQGIVPQASVEILLKVGEMLKENP